MKSSTNKILTVAVVLLLLTNIALVAFIMLGKNKCSEKRSSRIGTSDMMAKELNMTEEQKKSHKLLKDEHMKNVKVLFDSLKLSKVALYSLLKDSVVNDSLINYYSQQVGNRQAQIEKMTFAHFKRKRSMFTAEQRPKFDTFIIKMMQGGKRDSAAKKEK
jgi:periplasmic protein CpxP/Spy